MWPFYGSLSVDVDKSTIQAPKLLELILASSDTFADTQKLQPHESELYKVGNNKSNQWGPSTLP